MTLLIILILAGAVAVQFGETDAQRKARIQANEAYIVRVACKLGDRACAIAKEDAHRVTCKLLQEDCTNR